MTFGAATCVSRAQSAATPTMKREMNITAQQDPYDLPDSVRLALEVDLQAYSFGENSSVLSALTDAVDACGGWLVDRRMTAAAAAELRIELHLHGAIDLYAMLQTQGLELTRDTHRVLTELCTVQRRMTGGARRMVNLRLEVNFLERQTLHSLLMTGCAFA
jgi:hypothetical protein